MGEVYRARDTRLGRDIAVKILPAEFSKDLARRQRFEREARTISGLNHPNICVLHDVGTQGGLDYLVMECVEGETLAKRLEKGALALEQVLKYGAQIADALDKAHRAGIVHRDLKPGNIMLTPSGAKLLDFGLAKPVALASGMTLTAVAPTSPVTQEGTIIGTFQYMSPEQVEGKEVDGRSDIFSLGAVLYEMLTGKRAFEGKSQLSVASAILEKEPEPISSVKPLTPPVLDHVIRKCLAKSAEERWQSASDLASELKWIAEARISTGAHAAVTARKGRASWAYAVAGVVVAALALGGLLLWRGRSAREPVVRLTITRPESEPIRVNAGPALAFSPDGRRIAFVVAHGADTQLVLRDLSSFDAKAVPGTEGAETPFFSPDGEWLAFIASGRVKKVPVNGGAAIDLIDVATSAVTAVGGANGGTWLADGSIVLNSGMTAGLVRVPASGGKPEPVPRPDGDKAGAWQWWPEALPGGGVLFTMRSGEGPGESSIAVLSMKTGKYKTMVEKGEYAHYSPDGHIVYLQNGTLLAVPFDEERMEVTGPAEPVMGGVQYTPSAFAQFAIAANGTLAYIPGTAKDLNNTLVTIDRNGREEALKVPPRGFEDMDLSPDGKLLAMTVIGGQQWNVWIYDLQQGSLNRLTFEGDNRDPMWSADGKRVIYGSTRNGRRGLYWKPVSGTGGEEQLLDANLQLFPSSMTSDGKYLIYESGTWEDTGAIYALPLQGERTPKVLFEQRGLASGKVSPNRKWLAYESAESGRTEIYVRKFNGGAEKRQISTEGGEHALWSRDGGELYFRSSGAKGTMVMSTTIGKGEEFTFSPPRALFRFGCITAGPHDYGVMGNGQKIVCIKEPEAETKATQVNVVLNWASEFKKK